MSTATADEQKQHEDRDQKDCIEQRNNDEVQKQPGELRQILRTSDFYKTKNLPERFDRPGLHTA